MSNKDVTTTSSGGIGICTVLFLIFLVLKLCNVINWSWWWVTAPLWLPFVLVLAISLVIFFVGFCIGIFRYIVKNMKGKR